MKKLGFIIFIAALVVGVVIAKFTSFGSSAFNSPASFIFGSKLHGSGNLISQTRNTGDFKVVKVGGILNVVINKSDTQSVVVEADDNIAPVIKTRVRSGVLEIWSDKKFRSKKKVTIRIGSPSISGIDSSGVAKVRYTGIDNESLDVESSGASKVELEGNVGSIMVESSGASKVLGEKLVAENAEVEGSGAAKVLMTVNSKLRVSASGASRIKYKGDPGVIEKSTSGAASVSKIN